MFLKKIYIASGLLSAISIISMCLLIVAQVVARNMNSHIPSSADISGYLVVWATYFGLSYAMYHLSHIRVELIISKLSYEKARVMNIIVGIVAILLVSLLSYYNVMLVFDSIKFEDVTDGELKIPVWIVQFPIVIGSLTFLLSVIEYTLMQIIEKESYKQIDKIEFSSPQKGEQE